MPVPVMTGMMILSMAAKMAAKMSYSACQTGPNVSYRFQSRAPVQRRRARPSAVPPRRNRVAPQAGARSGSWPTAGCRWSPHRMPARTSLTRPHARTNTDVPRSALEEALICIAGSAGNESPRRLACIVDAALICSYEESLQLEALLGATRFQRRRQICTSARAAVPVEGLGFPVRGQGVGPSVSRTGSGR
jgi:hypothetical protein